MAAEETQRAVTTASTTVLAAMSVAVSMTIATSVSASIGGAAAGSTAGTAGGGAAGGAASGGASVAIAPLVLGAQRFTCSSGVAIDKSDLQDGVAGNMEWATGEFDFLSPVSRRRLTEEQVASSRPEELRRLLNLLISATIGLVLCCAIQLFLACLWRHWINRPWHREQSTVTPIHEPIMESEKGATSDPPPNPAAKLAMRKMRKPAKFTAYPKSLVWPVPLFFSCSMFLTGLTRASVYLLASSPPGCTAACTAIAVGTMSGVAVFMVMATFFLVSFRHGAGRVIKFKPGAKVPKPADPIMRMRANIRTFTYSLATRVSNPRSGRLHDVRAAARLTLKEKGHKDRKVGGWSAIPEADAEEPARTYRLLAHPFRFRHDRVGDGWQAREGFLMFRTNGKTTIGAYYRLFVLFVNVCFGLLSGLQPALTPGSTPALVQAMVVMGLQLMMAIVCFCATPDADRIISTFAGTQFFCEASSTACLIFASFIGGSDDVAAASKQRVWLLTAFWAGLLAIFVPMTQLLEQRLVTPLIVLVEKGSGNPLVLAAQLYILIVSLPRRIIRVVTTIAGMDDMDAGDAGADATADAGDEADANEVGGDQKGEDQALYSADQAAEQAAKASKLLARATAAKEVSSKDILLGNGNTAPPPNAAPNPEARMTSLVEGPEVASSVYLTDQSATLMSAETINDIHEGNHLRTESDEGGSAVRVAAMDADDGADDGAAAE